MPWSRFAVPQSRMEPRATDAIDELGWTLDVPDREVAVLAGFETADAVEQAESPGGFTRDAGDAFVDGEPEQRRPHVHGEQQRSERRRTRVAIGRDGDGNA